MIIPKTVLHALALWRFNEWSIKHVKACFCNENMSKDDIEYWMNKFRPDILDFYLTLDPRNKVKFEEYLNDQLKNYI